MKLLVLVLGYGKLKGRYCTIPNIFTTTHIKELLDTNLESWNYNLGFHTMYVWNLHNIVLTIVSQLFPIFLSVSSIRIIFQFMNVGLPCHFIWHGLGFKRECWKVQLLTSFQKLYYNWQTLKNLISLSLFSLEQFLTSALHP